MDTKTVLDTLNSSLDLDREVVGIRFLKTKEAYENSLIEEIKTTTPYCCMVKLATLGYGFKCNLELSKCAGGTRALGLEDATDRFHSGEEYFGFEMYESEEVAQSVANDITLLEERIYGLEIMALELFTEEPDVVITITNSYNAMRMTQGYTYKFGTQKNFKLTGNQAICSECTAYPYMSDSINISMLCAGTRHLAGWKEEEIAIGLPYHKFLETVDGVYQSINGAESNEKKEEIVQKLTKNNMSTEKIHKDDAYFLKE